MSVYMLPNEQLVKLPLETILLLLALEGFVVNQTVQFAFPGKQGFVVRIERYA